MKIFVYIFFVFLLLQCIFEIECKAILNKDIILNRFKRHGGGGHHGGGHHGGHHGGHYYDSHHYSSPHIDFPHWHWG
uniref:Uncharacterized protein n=1 Tax=Acrobeloides nanus TaxID=290746 RepID=A0A914CGW3_9BILA